MTTVLVTGGSGMLGGHVVRLLRERGDEVRVLSRRPGRGTHVGDLARGTGVAGALAGVERVVHAATNSPTGRADLRQTENLLVAARSVAQRVGDLVAGEPAGHADDFAGPEVLDLRRVAEAWRARHADGRQTWGQFVHAQTNHTPQGAGR